MAKEIKSKAKVMSINEHNMVVSNLSSQIERLDSELKLKDDIIEGYKKEVKDYVESTSKLHNQLKENRSEIHKFCKVIEGLDKELSISKKNQKKWYHFF
jgi:chromosome segregation ATPase